MFIPQVIHGHFKQRAVGSYVLCPPSSVEPVYQHFTGMGTSLDMFGGDPISEAEEFVSPVFSRSKRSGKNGWQKEHVVMEVRGQATGVLVRYSILERKASIERQATGPLRENGRGIEVKCPPPPNPNH